MLVLVVMMNFILFHTWRWHYPTTSEMISQWVMFSISLSLLGRPECGEPRTSFGSGASQLDRFVSHLELLNRWAPEATQWECELREFSQFRMKLPTVLVLSRC